MNDVMQDYVDYLNGKFTSKSQVYIYATRSRPAGYGTVPEGFQVHSEESNKHYPYGQIAYDRQLTQAEVYSYELMPVSSNAYKYHLGAIVDYCGDDCLVVGHEWNSYIKLVDVDRKYEPFTVRQDDKDLELVA